MVRFSVTSVRRPPHGANLAVMPSSVARLVVGAIIVALGKMCAAGLFQMVVFGEIGSDQEDGCEGEPSKQDEADHHKLRRWRDAASARIVRVKTRPFRGAAMTFSFL